MNEQVKGEVSIHQDLEQCVFERTAQLEAANKELATFSYGLSHNLRAPLRHINGFSQALLEDYEDKLDETGKHYLHRLCAASEQTAQLIEALALLARASQGVLQLETVNLSELCREEITRLQQKDPARTVTVNIEKGLFTHGDKRLLQTALSNLLENAWKFTSKQERAEITFGQEQTDNSTCYFVRDNGAGFRMANADRLFGIFQRLHKTAEFEGAGMGLATVQRIVHRHGGSIRAKAAVDQGATFYFTLPSTATALVGQASSDSVMLNSNNHE